MEARRTRALAAPLVGLLVAGGCDTPFDATPSSSLDDRGITVADWTSGGIAGEAGMRCLDDVVDAGGNIVMYIVTVYQEEATSSAISSIHTPALDAFRTAADAARARGLRIGLKLHVDVRDGTWRANIRPDNPGAWFEDYGQHVALCAIAARDAGADTFVLGTELAGTIEHEGRWRELVASVRARYPGRVLYAASWDETMNVPFWDALDAIGVDAYFAVAGRRDASRMELLAGWQPWLDRLESLSRRTGRDIVFTEIGYRSVDGAGEAPAEFLSAGTPDAAEQADLYWAALTALETTSRVRGVYWWNFVLPDGAASQETDYTPQGKPALEVLRATWSPAP